MSSTFWTLHWRRIALKKTSIEQIIFHLLEQSIWYLRSAKKIRLDVIFLIMMTENEDETLNEIMLENESSHNAENSR